MSGERRCPPFLALPNGDIVLEDLGPRLFDGMSGPRSALRLTRDDLVELLMFWLSSQRAQAFEAHGGRGSGGNAGGGGGGVWYLPTISYEPLQTQGAPRERVDQPEQPAEKHQAADLDGLRVGGEDPQQEAQHGENERPEGDQHGSEPTAADVVCGDVFETGDPSGGHFILCCGLPPGHSGDHVDGKQSWNNLGPTGRA